MFITGDVTKKAGGKLPFVFSKKKITYGKTILPMLDF
jgi:hypothetical protein